jgi:1,4-dihydroxy-2-naphthoate octaprenyltransferase
MSRLVRSLLGISRAPFLLLPVTLIAAGTAAAVHADPDSFDGLRTTVALIGLVLAHAAVNALNEASDMETGIDLKTVRTPFSGGSGTLPSGAMSVGAAYRFALGAFCVAAGTGMFLVLEVGWVLVPIILLGAFSILAYTHVLARIGLGEIFAGLGLGGLPVLGACAVQDGRMTPVALLAAVPATLMTFNLLLLNEFPDEDADREGGRRNLVILSGRPAAARIYIVAALGVPATVAVAVAVGMFPVAALVACLPTLSVVPAIRWGITSPEDPVPVPALAGNVAWNLVTNVALALALFLTA